jgi:hypothetical protein
MVTWLSNHNRVPVNRNRSVGQGIPRNYGIWMSTKRRNAANRPYPKPLDPNLRPIYLSIRSITLSRLYRRRLYIQFRFPNPNYICTSHFRLTSSPFFYRSTSSAKTPNNDVIYYVSFLILLLFPLYYAQFIRECNFEFHCCSQITEYVCHFDLLLLCSITLFCTLWTRCGRTYS